MARAEKPFDALVRMVGDPTSGSAVRDAAMLEQVVALAIRHRVAGFVALATKDAGMALPDELAAAQSATTAMHLQAIRALGRVAAALDGAGLPWAVVKGPVLATRWHGAPEARGYDDLDLLVDPRDFAAAVDVLRSAGFEHRSRNWSGFRELGVGELPLSDGTTVIDLHWHLVGLHRSRAALNVPTAELLARSVEVQVGSVRARTLDDADTLVHLCVHDALAGAQRLVHLRDVHLVARGVEPGLASERVRRARAGQLAAPVVDRAERLFGPVGPRPLAPQLVDGRIWLGLNRLVDASWSRLLPRHWTPFPHSLVGAGRDSVPATVALLWSGIAHSVRTRAGLSTIVSDDGPLDWDHDAGGDEERERFFSEVAAGCYGR